MRKPAGFTGSFFRPNLPIATRKKGQGDLAPDERARNQEALQRDDIES